MCRRIYTHTHTHSRMYIWRMHASVFSPPGGVVDHIIYLLPCVVVVRYFGRFLICCCCRLVFFKCHSIVYMYPIWMLNEAKLGHTLGTNWKWAVRKSRTLSEFHVTIMLACSQTAPIDDRPLHACDYLTNVNNNNFDDARLNRNVLLHQTICHLVSSLDVHVRVIIR